MNCSLKDCPNRHHKQGYCEKHYLQSIHGELPLCYINGCKRPVEIFNMCQHHYDILAKGLAVPRET